MRWVIASVAGLLVMAGCSGSGGDAGGQTPEGGLTPEEIAKNAGEIDVEATDSTGIIVGVVIDSGIKPIAGATITLEGGSGQTTTSNANGAFGFEGLAPGTYFFLVSKIGYKSVQSNTDVVAGEADPPIVRVQLQADPTQGAFYRDFHFEGFLACSVRPFIIGFAACSQFNFATEPFLGEDVFSVNYEFDRVPDWVQVELIWDETQQFGSDLSLAIDCFSDSCPEGLTGVNRSEGLSPLFITINRTVAEFWHYGPSNSTLTVRVFAYHATGTDFVDEDSYYQQVNDTTGGAVPCAQWPDFVFEGSPCIRIGGLGIILQQRFDVYTTIFYGYTPPKGWMFTNGDPIPQPPT